MRDWRSDLLLVSNICFRFKLKYFGTKKMAYVFLYCLENLREKTQNKMKISPMLLLVVQFFVNVNECRVISKRDDGTEVSKKLSVQTLY